MARIRTIKPDFFTSLTVNELTVLARLTFIGLWTYADDEGRAVDDARLVKAALYPLDDTVSCGVVEAVLGELAGHGLIHRYSAGPKRFLSVRGFGEHQRINRPTPSRIPEPPSYEPPQPPHGGLTEDSVRIRGAEVVVLAEMSHEQGEHDFTEDSVSAHGGLTSGKERKGREQGRELELLRASTDVDPQRTQYPPEFDRWWATYPKRKGKAAALAAWKKLGQTRPCTDELIAAVGRYRQTREVHQGFVMDAERWLKQRRWEDEAVPFAAEAAPVVGKSTQALLNYMARKQQQQGSAS